MANQFKFVGVDDSTSGSALSPLGSGNPLVSETYVIKSILVTEDAGSGSTITITLVNSSGTIFNLFKDKAIASKASTELLTNPLVMEESEVLKVQAADANELHVIASILEIQPREVTT